MAWKAIRARIRPQESTPAPADEDEWSIAMTSGATELQGDQTTTVITLVLDRTPAAGEVQSVLLRSMYASDFASNYPGETQANGNHYTASLTSRIQAAVDATPGASMELLESADYRLTFNLALWAPGQQTKTLTITRLSRDFASPDIDRRSVYQLHTPSRGSVTAGTATVVIQDSAPVEFDIADVFLGTAAGDYATLANGIRLGPYCARSAAADTSLAVITCKDVNGSTITPDTLSITNHDGFGRFKIASATLKVDAVAPDFEGPGITNASGYTHTLGVPFYQITITAVKNGVTVQKAYQIPPTLPLVAPTAQQSPTTVTPTTETDLRAALVSNVDDVIVDMRNFTGVLSQAAGSAQTMSGNRRIWLGNPQAILWKGGGPVIRGNDWRVVNCAIAPGAGTSGLGRNVRDALGLNGSRRTIIKYASLCWSIDGLFDSLATGAIAPSRDIWLDHCALFNPLRRAGHSSSEPVHAFGSNHHCWMYNLVITNSIMSNFVSRFPALQAGCKGVYIANNIIANNGSYAIQMAGARESNPEGSRFPGMTVRLEDNLIVCPATAYPYPVATQTAQRAKMISFSYLLDEQDFIYVPLPGDDHANHFVNFVSPGVWNFASDPLDRTVHRTIQSTAPEGASAFCSFKPFELSAAAQSAYNITAMNSAANRQAKFEHILANAGCGTLVDPLDHTSARVSGHENAQYLTYEMIEVLNQTGLGRFETGGYKSTWPSDASTPVYDAATRDSTYDRYHTPAPPHAALLPWTYRSNV